TAVRRRTPLEPRPFAAAARSLGSAGRSAAGGFRTDLAQGLGHQVSSDLLRFGAHAGGQAGAAAPGPVSPRAIAALQRPPWAGLARASMRAGHGRPADLDEDPGRRVRDGAMPRVDAIIFAAANVVVGQQPN